ncbi:SDR family oxidoreductase [Vulcaniibacterium thermophilum]|uniref:Short-chain dehydrogenase n=1 Tax=Vulcaniibacterium thermophilum TaxID=1169913 RepID=A0A919DBD4_9GAMM|nr:SDR family oxidoreductase [Vulcaniibacterium thermophilum]GHE28035.1 short-chain dehydrogenase [Vulcaniibacterium thermophilum]
MTRHCLVTGANRGLGLEFVRQLLARGDRVVATARRPAQAHDLNRLSGEHPGRLHVLPLDVADPRSHAELARELPLADEHGLDLLVHNAGVMASGERFGTVAARDLDSAFRTNAAGPFLLTQALAARLAPGAKVAAIGSSLGAMSATARFGTPSYAISKAALNMAVVQLAHALRERGIAVYALNPGWVRTAMGGERAPLLPQDSVAAMLRTLDRLALSDSGGFFQYDGERLGW